MKRMPIRRTLCTLLCILLAASTSALAVESDDTFTHVSTVYIEGGKIANNAKLQSVIDKYFSAREEVLKPDKTRDVAYIESLDTILDSTDNSLLSHEQERLNAWKNMAYYHGEYVIDSQIIPTVEKVTPVKLSGYDEAYEVKVYEWTWVDYNDGHGGPIDRMGYATDHDMIIAVSENGKAAVVSNQYDDSMFTGVPDTGNYDAEFLRDTPVAESDASLLATTTNVSVNEIIEYADKWVGRTNQTNGVGVNANYNPSYASFTSQEGDCANYVSQCLRAGGMAFDYGKNGEKIATDSDDWWYDGSLSENIYQKSSIAWRSVPSMIKYWNETKKCSYLNATTSNIYPGNPVFHYGKDAKGNYGYFHVGICVGYNYNDVPIINAHTSDVYHVPYTHFASPKTIQIFTSNRLAAKPSEATAITPSSTMKTSYKGISSGKNAYFKINHPSSKTSTYSIKLGCVCESSSLHMYVYQQKRNDSFMYELKHDVGRNISLTMTVNPNYNYYIRCYYEDTPSGTMGVTLSYQLL